MPFIPDSCDGFEEPGSDSGMAVIFPGLGKQSLRMAQVTRCFHSDV